MAGAERGGVARHARLLDFEIHKNKNTQGYSLVSRVRYVVGQYLFVSSSLDVIWKEPLAGMERG